MPKLWAANLLSRQLPAISSFAFIVGECPLRRLANRPIPRGAVSPLYYIPRVFRPLAIQNNLQRRSLNNFLLEEQLCQLFDRIPAGGQKTANLLVRVGH